jgi:hypothetical protein
MDQYNLTAAAHAPDAIKPFVLLKCLAAVETNGTDDTSNFNCDENNHQFPEKRKQNIPVNKF